MNPFEEVIKKSQEDRAIKPTLVKETPQQRMQRQLQENWEQLQKKPPVKPQTRPVIDAKTILENF